MWLQRIKSLGDICKTTQLLCTASPAASGVCSVFQGGNLEETWGSSLEVCCSTRELDGWTGLSSDLKPIPLRHVTSPFR